MKYFKNAEGGWDLVKIVIPLIILWMGWVTYNGYATRHLLKVEEKLDFKYSKMQTAVWQKLNEDAVRHDKRIDDLYLLVAGGQDGTENNLDCRERPRSGLGAD